MGPPIETEFRETLNKQKEEFKAIQIPQNCEYMKTSYLNSEIYSKLYEAAVNKDKCAQHFYQKEEETLDKFRAVSLMLIRYIITFLQKPREKGKLMCVIHWEDLKNAMPTVHQQ